MFITYDIIEVPDENDSCSRVVLENTLYAIRFTWNSEGEYWKFGLYLPDMSPIVQGIKIVPNFPLNVFQTSAGLPFGVFLAATKLPRIGRKDFADGTAEFRYTSVAENARRLQNAAGS